MNGSSTEGGRLCCIPLLSRITLPSLMALVCGPPFGAEMITLNCAGC